MKNLYKFYWYCGRMGNLEGLFIAEESEVQEIIEKEVYFGEVLGRHSEVYGKIRESDITLVSDDQEKVAWLENLLGNSVSGYNPFDYYEPEQEEDDSDD